MEQTNSFTLIVAPFVGWIFAQGIKFALTLRKDGIEWSDAIRSGGMPSSHTSFMIALTTAIGLDIGYASVSFAVALALSCIIMYDAVGVRRTTGEQTDAIEQLAKHNKISLRQIHDAKGHSPIEVVVGIVVGMVAGVVTTVIL